MALPYTDDLWSQPGLRRLCRLLRFGVPALIAFSVFGVGFAAVVFLGGAHRMPGGIPGPMLLAGAAIVVAGPSVVDGRRLERRLRRLALPGDATPADNDDGDLCDDPRPRAVGSLVGPR